jgi:hypothetical protein
MARRPRNTGACYLVCWAKTPYKHAGHYLGFAYELPGVELDGHWQDIVDAAAIYGPAALTAEEAAGVAFRLACHMAGTGANLTAVVAAAGITWDLVRVWPGCTEQEERWLKDLNNRVKLCPRCSPDARWGVTPGRKRKRRKRWERAAGPAPAPPEGWHDWLVTFGGATADPASYADIDLPY